MNFRFEKRVNPNDQKVYWQAQTAMRLISVSETLTTNVNSTPYYNCVAEYENADGEVKETAAIIYKTNYEYGMEVGKSYLTTIRIVPGDPRGPLVQLSHLQGSAKATAADFGFELPEESETTAKVEQKVTAEVGDGPY